MGFGLIDVRFFLVGLLAMPYALFGMIYSDPKSPKSEGAWFFYLFFGIALFLVLSAFNVMDKKGFETADLIMLAVLTHIAFSQVRLLLRARRQYFGVNSICNSEPANRDNIEPFNSPY